MFEIVNWTVCKLSKIIQQLFDIFINYVQFGSSLFKCTKINLSLIYYIILRIKVLTIMIFLINCLT